MILAIVVEGGADGCRVRVLGQTAIREAGYTEPFRPRAGSVGPGCLVALDVTTEPVRIVWRWFPATVSAVEDDRLVLDEPFHGVVEAPVPVDSAPVVGETVYATTGLSDGWRIDAGGHDPERATAVLPQVVGLYLRHGWA